MFWVLAAGILVLIAVACTRQQIVLLNHQEQADAAYAEALTLYDAEDYNGTIEMLETEIDSGIDSVEIYYLLGQAYEMADDMDAALSTYAEGAYKYASKSEAEILTEAQVTFYSAQMQAAYEAGEFGTAVECSNQILSLDQDNQEAQALLDAIESDPAYPYYQYINETLISQYGQAESGQTTEISAHENHTETWLQGGILSAVTADLDADGEYERLVFLLEEEEEDDKEGVTLYAQIYEKEKKKFVLSDSAYLARIDDSDWWKHGWNVSLVSGEETAYYILFEDCGWANENYARVISLDEAYEVKETYNFLSYNGVFVK